MNIKLAKKAMFALFLAFAMTACSASFSTNTGTNNSNNASNANSQNKASNTNSQNTNSNTNSQNTASNANSQNKASNTSSQSTSGTKKEFTVFNKTKTAITGLMVSEDNKTFGEFDVGSGIPAGKSEVFVWDKATDKEKCTQWFKAVYADKSESEAAKFDFCAEKLELEFEE